MPVLLDEVIEQLNVRADGRYIDATFGRGGHSRALLARLGAGGRLLVIDRDPDALVHARALAADDARVEVADAAFSAIGEVAGAGEYDGILFDIGLSSPQLDDAARGFSFRHDAPLDMRMDPRHGQSAAAWLAQAEEHEIADVLYHYGEERRSRRIARRVVEQRRAQPITTTTEFANLVRACVPFQGGRIDPATRSFQALRILVNDELGELERALARALELLAVGGRLLVIAFHSLEDRLVKQCFRDLDDARRAADHSASVRSFRLVGRKPLMAGEAELARNPRARSARLRTLERVA